MVFLSLFSERRRTQFRSQLSAERGTRYHDCFPGKTSSFTVRSCVGRSHARHICTTVTGEATASKKFKEIDKFCALTCSPPPQPSQNRRYFHGLFSDKQAAVRGEKKGAKERSQSCRQTGRQAGRGGAQRDQPVTSSRFTSSSNSAVMEEPSSSPAFLPWRLRVRCPDEVQRRLT